VRYLAILSIVCVVLFTSVTVIYGQAVTGTLVGTVTDVSGASVPSAKVTVTEASTGVSRSTVSNESGNYSFPDLPPGTYTVTVEQTGFKKISRADIPVLVNSSIRADLTLTPGAVTETVDVTAEAPMLQTERADTGRKVETKLIEDLPVSTPGGRNFQALLNLVPGTTRAFRPHSEFFNPQNSLSTQVNGQSRVANNLQLDGIDDNERTGLLQVYIPALEALQTVDISTSNFEAELGRSTGAVTNAILKSGTNDWHGQAYWFNRVSALSSRAFYDPVRPHFVFNYVGGQFGGPIIRNKTFFFTDYLRVMDRRYNVDRYTLPTAAERAGDLSASTTPIYDPRTGNPDGTGRLQFANNQIPSELISPVALRILSLVPLPNLPGLNQNYYTQIPFSRDSNQIDAKIDHNANEANRISLRFSYFNPQTTDQSAFGNAGGPHGGGFEATGSQATYNGAINYNRILSPTLLTEARAGVNRYRNQARQIDYGLNDAEALGVPGVNVNDFTSGQVGIDISGFSSPLVGYSASLPWIRAETNIDLVNTWTKLKGNHTLKWGVELRRIRDDLLQTQTYSPRGRYSFGGAQTSIPGAPTSFGNNFASFLLDLPSEVGRDLPIIFPAYRAWEFYTFVQDRWVITPKLTLDLGLRWEFYPPATPAHTGGFSNYNPATNSLIIAGVGGNPLNAGRHTNYRDFAPRIGLAYRLTDKTVFRGGFGISYFPYPDNTYAYNFPVKQNNSYLPNFPFGAALLPNGQVATLSSGFPAPTPAVIPPNGIIPNADPNQVYFYINPNFKEPSVQSWNIAIQQALPHNMALDVAYVGNHGVHQPMNYNLNASTTLNSGVAGQPLYAQFGRKASVEDRYVGVSSRYNALQVKFDKRFSSGFAMTTSYTFGKAMGYGGGDEVGLTFYINQQRNWHVLEFNRAHTFVQSYVYELPFGPGKRWLKSGATSAVLGGWQVNGVLTIASGTPINFGGNSSVLNSPGNGNTLNYFGDGIQILHGTGRNAWFAPTICSATVTANCFSQPGNLQFGNLGLYPITGPGYWNLDASVFKQFKVTERMQLELRGEGFSVVNTPQWGNPDTAIGNTTFGQITSAGGNRQIQLGAKVIF
jgi:hypothetical protein